MQPRVERIQYVACRNHTFLVFGIMQALHNRRDDVATRAPYGAFDSSHARPPEPGILAAPLANGEIQRPSSDLFRLLNGVGNLRVLRRARPPLVVAAAPVNLDVVETPLRKLKEVLVIVTLAAGIHNLRAGVGAHAASVSTGVGVDAGLQSQAVNVYG